MLKIHTAGLKLAADVDLAELADRLEGYSGADVQLVCRDAAMAPMRAAIAGKSPDEIVELQTKGQLEGEITLRDFLGAVETTPPSIAPGSLKRFEAWNAEFGCELIDGANITSETIEVTFIDARTGKTRKLGPRTPLQDVLDAGEVTVLSKAFAAQQQRGKPNRATINGAASRTSDGAVSYTHLTLPTILLV